MIEQEIRRLKDRISELNEKILPQLEHRTEFLYTQILPLPKGSNERESLEQEYSVLSKELRMRSDERLSALQQADNLEAELTRRNARPNLLRR